MTESISASGWWESPPFWGGGTDGRIGKILSWPSHSLRKQNHQSDQKVKTSRIGVPLVVFVTRKPLQGWLMPSGRERAVQMAPPMRTGMKPSDG